MTAEILKKYNIPVPRYTSYPPANFFGEMDADTYRSVLAESDRAANRKLSFYFHIPFCRHLCHYCGCNSYSMRRPEAVKSYVDALHKEIDMMLPLISSDRTIAQIHYGGGSPTAIPFAYLKELNEHLLSKFSTIDRPEIAIECHPGYLSENDWAELCDCGFTRFSIGVQDVHADVLKAVNRRGSLIPLEDIFNILRQRGKEINLDFIYGLPLQTPERFLENMELTAQLRPDRVVTFSYAHVPWMFKQQQILEKTGLPPAADKQQMFDRGSRLLTDAGYVTIGLDHFVLPEDELYTALQQGMLHRNFQGYCTRRTTAQVYAFGVTGITQLETAYAQNTKNIDEYIEKMNRGEWAVTKGYCLNREQMITREVIETLMCNYKINWQEVAQRLGLTPEAVKAATAYRDEKLREMEADGLIKLTDEAIVMTDEGGAMVRCVAASLDKMMTDTDKKFSTPV